MAHSGGGSKPFSPFTITASQVPAPLTSTASAFQFGTTQGISAASNPLASASASAPQLSFVPSNPATTTSSSFNFGAPAASASNLSGLPQVPINPNPTVNFGVGNAAASAASSASVAPVGISFGITTSQSSLNLGGVSSSTGAAASLVPAAASFSAPLHPTVTTAYGAPITTAAANSNVLTASNSASTPSISFGAGTPGAGGLGKPAAAAATIAAGLGATTSTTAAATSGTDTSTTQLTTATATTQSAPTSVSQMNFRQLQELINKWMIELQDQEKEYLDQATKVNSRDMTLYSNGDKIAKLNESITKVKADHTRLQHALDYLKNQQEEFEGFLGPLEAGLPANLPVEPERERLYTATEKVDTQLQQMSEDLREIIRHINESNKTVDRNDPIFQILRILNEHTDALHWVEENANQVRRSLDGISRQHQMAKKEHEHSLRTMFK